MIKYKKIIILPLIFSLLLCGCSQAAAESFEDGTPVSLSEETEDTENDESASEYDGTENEFPYTVDNGNGTHVTVFSSWKQAGEYLDRDFSLCAEDNGEVDLAEYLSDNFNLVQSYFGKGEGTLTPREHPYPKPDEYREPVLESITALFPKSGGTVSDEELYGYADEFKELFENAFNTEIPDYSVFDIADISAGDTDVHLIFSWEDPDAESFSVTAIYKDCLYQMSYENINSSTADKTVDEICGRLNDYICLCYDIP